MTLKDFKKNPYAVAFGVFLLSQVFISLVLTQTIYFIFDPASTWSRWDSGHYLAIAQKGYEFMSCAGIDNYPLDTKDWCGNTGWFPLYSWTIKFLTTIGMNNVWAGYLLSEIFFFLFLIIAAKILIHENKSTAPLLLASVFPGFYYYHAIFPISMFLFFALSSLYAYTKHKLVVAGVLGFLAGLAYSTGFLLTFVYIGSLFWQLLQNGYCKINVKKTIVWTAPIAGLGAFCFFLYIETGYWDAFFKVQAKYGHGWHNPVVSLWFKIKSIWLVNPKNNWINIQTVVVAIWIIIHTIYLFIKRKQAPFFYVFLWFFSFVYWIFPLTVGGNLSMYRAESLLLPSVLLISYFNKNIGLKTSIAFVVFGSIGWTMALLFFWGTLV